MTIPGPLTRLLRIENLSDRPILRLAIEPVPAAGEGHTVNGHDLHGLGADARPIPARGLVGRLGLARQGDAVDVQHDEDAQEHVDDLAHGFPSWESGHTPVYPRVWGDFLPKLDF